ncbi:rRNA methyltransferase [Cohnella kolymensis]|uniref:rRNA methyltransferase n=1 Tax=Cohnella kolymensis TaxID=1590652 RepID=A0ABR5A598_9BACL|nr:RNA methyltransferase [Cohnella kolymensis]KIL36097.1 rRNA methyltransferase [Cohnella kolymensis]
MPNFEGYISSASNPRVKEWAKLLDRKHRQREGKFLLEGVHLVKEALDSGWPLELVAFDEGSEVGALFEEYVVGNESGGPSWIPVSPDVIAKCTETETPQPIFAVAKKRPPNSKSLFETERALVAVLDGVQDPGNVGTIVRSAAACGASAVVLGKGTADLYNPKTIRATMGAVFHVPVLEADLTELLPEAKSSGAAVAGTSLQATQSCYDYDFRRNVWLVFGNEGSGLSTEVSRLVDHQMIIPMTGRAESLNVAMAATVLLFEAQRQRMI